MCQGLTARLTSLLIYLDTIRIADAKIDLPESELFPKSSCKLLSRSVFYDAYDTALHTVAEPTLGRPKGVQPLAGAFHSGLRCSFFNVGRDAALAGALALASFSEG